MRLNRFAASDYINAQPLFNVPDASYDRTKAASALGVYKDIRTVPVPLLSQISTNRTDVAAFFYPAIQADKDRMDFYVSLGYLKVIV
jgi:hypothetical protein